MQLKEARGSPPATHRSADKTASTLQASSTAPTDSPGVHHGPSAAFVAASSERQAIGAAAQPPLLAQQSAAESDSPSLDHSQGSDGVTASAAAARKATRTLSDVLSHMHEHKLQFLRRYRVGAPAQRRSSDRSVVQQMVRARDDLSVSVEVRLRAALCARVRCSSVLQASLPCSCMPRPHI